MISGNEISDIPRKANSFLKIGQEAHLLELSQGYLYLNQLWHFIEYPDHHRGDKFEGAIGCWGLDGLQIGLRNENNGEQSIIRDLNSFYLRDNRVLDCHVFCLYAYFEQFRIGRNIYTNEFFRRFRPYQNLDERVLELGDWILEIRKPKVFLNRIKEAFTAQNIHAETGLVQFFNEKTYNGRFPYEKKGFLKPVGYDYQQEFRILIDGLPKGPQKLFVGNLSDICTLTRLAKDLFRV